jgi:cytochrome c peroxidase
VPVPDQEASERIPVLLLFVHRTRQYGEVRFEEADGNYLLYLACNESFMENDCLEPFECALTNREMDPRSTPDTSGRTLRALCALNPGAAFPQEVAGTLTSPNSAAVRQMIGAAIGGAQLSLHENAGYKGQAIGFSSEGHVAVTGGSWTSYGSHLTVQAFVKVVTPTIGSDLMLVEDAGRFSLQLRADGSVRATVVVTGAGGTKQVTSPTGVVVPAQPVANPGVGWRHLALVYDGDETVTVNKVASNASTLMLYGDGVLLASLQWLENSSIANPPSFPLYVGPGRGVPTQNVSAANLKLLLDEVAISRVARTTDELRRDAYVPPVPSPFEPLPSAISLPVGLERSESKWPLGLAYSSSKVALGDALFESPLLSKNLDRSCATCHIPTDFFADANQVATAEDPPHLPLTFNVPTALNMSFGTHKLFDGSAATLEEQSVRPIKGPEMGPQAIGSVLTRIKNNAPLRALFDAAYPPLPNNAHVNEANLKESLAMYVRTFLTGGSAFDLDGQVRHGSAGTPLGAAAHRGRSLFFGKARCFGCHRGSNLSDDAFHNIGTVGASESILGRGGFTGRSSENGQLKTPTLRNVAQTGPWFHDGTLVSLHDVVAHYNAGFASAGGIGSLDRQLRPLGLTLGEIDDLVAFLGSLTGTVTP